MIPKGEHSQATLYALWLTAASEVLAAVRTVAVVSCLHASLPLQYEIRQKMPDLIAEYRITNIRPNIQRNRISGTSLLLTAAATGGPRDLSHSMAIALARLLRRLCSPGHESHLISG